MLALQPVTFRLTRENHLLSLHNRMVLREGSFDELILMCLLAVKLIADALECLKDGLTFQRAQPICIFAVRRILLSAIGQAS